jgi:hypothetical protein
MARIRVFAAAAFLLFPMLAFAGTGLSIQPVKVSVTLNPGETAEGTILLTNASDEAVQVDSSVQDFIPLAGADTIQFVGRAPGVTTVRDWITLDLPATSPLGHDERKEVHYTIHAPANAEPGERLLLSVVPCVTKRIRHGKAVLLIGTMLITGSRFVRP